MKIYKGEKDLKDKIEANLVADLATEGLRVTDKYDADKLANSLDRLKKSYPKNSVIQSCTAEILADLNDGKHPDLLFGSAILVSTVMNRNDDVFLPEETWKARYTPINTPFNDNHEQTRIIGHIIGVGFKNKEGDYIKEDTKDAPNFFDIEASFVMYQALFPKIAAEIKEKGETGEVGVSMECLIRDFDYALLKEDEDQVKIVARNEDTCFLTKHLRCYGGTGKYKGHIIGRVLRDFHYRGMGHVEVPANLRSKYTSLEGHVFAKFNNLECINLTDTKTNGKRLVNETIGTFSSDKKIFYCSPVWANETKGITMKAFESVEDAVKVINELEAKIKTWEESETSKKIENLKADLDKANTEKAGLEKELEAAKGKLEVAEGAKSEGDKAMQKMKEEFEKAEKRLKASEEKLEEIESTKRGLVRVAELKVENDEEAQAKYAKMAEDTYAEIKSFAEGFKPPKTELTEAEKAAKAEADAKKALDNAEPKDEIDPESTNASETETEQEKTMEVVAKAISLSRSKK
jgi:hypothetical protein